MAGVFRFGVVGIIHRSSSKPLVKAVVPSMVQSCGISGKILRNAQNIVKPKPYPYQEKTYQFRHAVFDRTTKRMDENSKVDYHRMINLQSIE